MRRTRLTAALLIATPALLAAGAARAAPTYDEFKIDREGPFEFAQKPVVKREGDRVTIAFETKSFCDVTVAIEESGVKVPGTRGGFREPSAKIVRHLASGVLGPNAPAPFRKNSKKQILVWDGKDERGRYIDDKASLAVRVSLGLTTRFERTLYWSPHKRTGATPPIARATPEGVYVYEDGTFPHLRFFDHDGNYVRTIYPFPPEKLDDVVGLDWRTKPQAGTRQPVKHGLWMETLFRPTPPLEGCYKGRMHGGPAMAVQGDRIALFKRRLWRLATDGSSGGRPYEGPRTPFMGFYKELWRGYHAGASPTSIAFSLDGTYLYMTRYPGIPPFPGVVRLAFEEGEKFEVFAGSMNQKESGKDNQHLNDPESVDVDAKGRVYVADHGNNRVQVFAPDGTYLKTIPVERPAIVRVNKRNGHVYVFSWPLRGYGDYRGFRARNPRLIHFGPLDDPKKNGVRHPDGKVSDTVFPRQIAAYPLGMSAPTPYAEIDSWTDPPTIWLARKTHGRGPLHNLDWNAMAMRLYVERDRELVVRHDFGALARKAVLRLLPPRHSRQRLYVNPVDGALYVGEGHSGTGKSFKNMVRIDPETGRVTIVELPFDCEDMAFGIEGHAYLRTENVIGRFDTTTWQEVPYDYGQEYKSVSFGTWDNGRSVRLHGGVPMPSVKPGCFHMGGMGVSPLGHVVVTCCNPYTPPVIKGYRGAQVEQALLKKYAPQNYPGRARGWDIHVWDERGNVLYQDAFSGIGSSHGINIDRHGNLYMLAAYTRAFDGKPYQNDRTGTLIKVRPREVKVLTAGKTRIPLGPGAPKRPRDIESGWIEDAEWLYGAVGVGGRRGQCSCLNCRPALDLFARSFVPEIENFSVAALDTNGNVILRFGRYGNVDDGTPSDLSDPSDPSDRSDRSDYSSPRDDAAFFNPAYLATDTDKRLFIADIGNARIVSTRLGYHTSETVPLKDVPDTAP